MFSSVGKYLKEGVESASQSLQQNERLRSVIHTLQVGGDGTSAASEGNDTEQVTTPSAPPDSSVPAVQSSAVVVPSESSLMEASTSDNASTHSASAPLPKHLVPCAHCSTMINTSLLETVLKTAKPFHHCRICAQVFCLKCLSKSAIHVPNVLLHENYQNPKGTEDRQYLCLHQCMPLAINVCLQTFRNEMHDKFAANFSEHVTQQQRVVAPQLLSSNSDEYGNIRFFPIPPLICEDNAYRRAMRFAYIAEAVADLSGYTLAIKAMKYAYMSNELMNILVAGDLFSVLSPLLETLKGYGITGPTAILRLYYLGCIHTARMKENMVLSKKERYASDRRGVIMSTCPPHLLRYVSQFVSPAQWLYHAALPAPHDSNDWSSWYLSNLIAKQRWTLLMNINASTKLPDGVKCPAFCIVTRVTRRRKAGLPLPRNGEVEDEEDYEVCREAMLVVRGSKSTMDWAINLQEELVEFSYWFKPKDKSVQQVMGCIHKGIYHGAMGVLDGFMARTFLLTLFNAGYDIRVVGHSLGAGVACVIAADLRNSIILSLYGSHTGEGGMLSATGSEQAGPCLDAERVSAVLFSCPSIVSENLAEAFQQDRLCVQVVHGADVIPRANHMTMQTLAKELVEAKVTTDIYRVQDQCDLTRYVTAMGRVNDIYTASSAELNEERYAKLRLKSEVETEKGRKRSADVIVVEDGDEVADNNEDNSSSNPLTSLSNSVSVAAMSGYLKEAEKGMKTVEEKMRQFFRRPSQVHAAPEEASSEEVQQETTYVEMSAVSVSTTVQETVPPPLPSKPQKPHKPAKPLSASIEPSAPLMEEVNLEDNSRMQEVPLEASSSTELQEHKVDHHLIRTVTPGPIIHIYRECDGSMHSSVISYDHDVFSELEVVHEQIIEDHAMATYKKVVAAAAFTSKRLAAIQDAKEEDEHRCDDMFPQHLQDRFVAALSSKVGVHNPHDNLALDKQKFNNTTHSTVSTVQQDVTEKQQLSVSVPMEEDIDADNLLMVEGKLTVEVEAVRSPASQCKWIPCSICHLDVTWPNMLHSDANRAMTTHRCASCQRVVCVVCAPAGDQIAGDGMSQKHSLPNFSIALPHLGLLTPQRVCAHCYYDSSHPGL